MVWERCLIEMLPPAANNAGLVIIVIAGKVIDWLFFIQKWFDIGHADVVTSGV